MSPFNTGLRYFVIQTKAIRRTIPYLPHLWFTIRSRSPNIKRIAKVRAPKLIIHNRDDEVAPSWTAEALFDAAPAATRPAWPVRTTRDAFEAFWIAR